MPARSFVVACWWSPRVRASCTQQHWRLFCWLQVGRARCYELCQSPSWWSFHPFSSIAVKMRLLCLMAFPSTAGLICPRPAFLVKLSPIQYQPIHLRQRHWKYWTVYLAQFPPRGARRTLSSKSPLQGILDLSGNLQVLCWWLFRRFDLWVFGRRQCN